MSSEGSNCESLLDNDIKSSMPVDASEPSSKDDDVYSLQSGDFINTPMSERAERLVTIQQLTFDPIVIRREFAKTVILHDYPLSIVDHMGFKAIFFNGIYPMISRKTLMSDILKVYAWERDCTMARFQGETGSRIAITTDKWISYDQTKRFMAITGHMIDDDWTIERRMMRFINVPCQCTNGLLAKITVECLFDWGISSRVSSIAIESCSSEMVSDILVDKLSSSSLFLGGKLLQTECFSHTVSLIVKDAVNVIEDVIEKIRHSILFWTATPGREKEFREATRELGISGGNHKLVLDSVSKWNTTFSMLQTALLYKSVFCHLKKESQFLCMPRLPTEEEWELVKEIHQKLKFFYTLLKRVSQYRAANTGFLHLSMVKDALSEWVLSDNVLVREMAAKMQEKFDKYWDAVRDIFAVASVLDPRLKLECVEFWFDIFYGAGAQCEIECIRQRCYDLFNEYQSRLDLEKTNADVISSSSLQDSDSSSDLDLYQRFLREKRKRRRKEPKKHELDTYLEREDYPYGKSIEDFNILAWWNQTTTYPTLKKMARDILAIPICSVAPEHMFDTGDRVLSPHRSRLSATIVQTLMCTQSWLWTDIKGSYSISNFFSWATNDDYAAIEDATAEEA